MQAAHSHVFLGTAHATNERRSWAVIVLCGAMMVAEIVGGLLFGSIALVADGMHMSTHAGALLLAALAYSYARRHSDDPRFSFGTGKLGDLAGFSSAIVLLMIAVLIGYEAISRLIAPVPIHFREAIPIAGLGLAVNLASAWLLGAWHAHAHGQHDHAHAADHGDRRLHRHDHGCYDHDHADHDHDHAGPDHGDTGHDHAGPDHGDTGHDHAGPDHGDRHHVHDQLDGGHDQHRPDHDHDRHHAHVAAHRDNNMRAAIVHVLADAAVSLLVIVGLSLAWLFGWLWMDPLAGMIGAAVIVSWSWTLIRDTGAVLLDMAPDWNTVQSIRRAVETAGDRLTDLHVWRLGPGHLGVIVAVATNAPHDAAFYRARLADLPALSHVTIEVQHGT
jgi:cation diffusion facilitator family transporter